MLRVRNLANPASVCVWVGVFTNECRISGHCSLLWLVQWNCYCNIFLFLTLVLRAYMIVRSRPQYTQYVNQLCTVQYVHKMKYYIPVRVGMVKADMDR
jgi:hypothetical protein